jgi:GNAT superfamily N-acetyltransferase
MNLFFRKAVITEVERIWQILQQAIERRRKDGSNQWQDGYPNPDVVKNDIFKGVGYVLEMEKVIIGYCAILINDEPEYERIIGKWLSNEDFIVYHRVAISDEFIGKGMATYLLKEIENLARTNNIKSIKADTNFDNSAMLSLFKKLGYTYCGEVFFRGSPRKAYEKLIE